MPTGFTDQINRGVSFENFVLSCARGMGACVTIRDEALDAPLPDEFKPDSYYQKNLEAAKNRLYDLRKMMTAEIDQARIAEWERRDREASESKARRDQQRTRYEAMLAKVRAWNPPTPDHAGLKKFMIDQITESIKFDCGDYDYPRPELAGSADWHHAACVRAEHDVKYNTEQLAEEEERCRQRTEWVKALKASLGVPPNGRVAE